jgi:putative restriction endonuclease
MPVLEAAHIQPYQGPRSNHVQNGILLRADFHRLYDTGYLTVTPDYRLEVSHNLREDFENGIYYYGLRGTNVRVPDLDQHKPSQEALIWHNENIFLG